MFRQIVEPDFVGLAAPTPTHNLAGRGPKRLLGEKYVRRRAGLVGDHRICLRIIIVELEEFRRDVAGRLEGARSEGVLDRNKRGASAEKGCRKRENKKQPHTRSTAGWTTECAEGRRQTQPLLQ